MREIKIRAWDANEHEMAVIVGALDNYRELFFK
jgi:hypothetical protein